MFLLVEGGDTRNYFYINDGKTFSLSKGKIDFFLYKSSCVVGKNWKGDICGHAHDIVIFEEGIEEINDIGLDFNESGTKIYFPKSLRKFNGHIDIYPGSPEIIIPDGASITFSPSSIKFYQKYKPFTVSNCKESGLNPSFIEYLQKQNYQFDKE